MILKCDNCGSQVFVHGHTPARCEVRSADEFGPATFLIVDAGWLVHRCTVVEAPSRVRAAAGWQSLTPAENRVVDLAATGMTNADIARSMFVSVNTVKTHLAHVFTKLRVSTRAELAARAAQSRSGAE
jgi:DNA-binding CsgD family transcriptional regulator